MNTRIAFLSFFVLLSAYTLSQGTKNTMHPPNINYDYSSVNFDDRKLFLVYHYTGGSMASALHDLMGQGMREVSSHFLINDVLNDMFKDYIYNLVPEDKRSWHAGISSWGADASLNASSIGVEVVNLDGNKYEYPADQVAQIIAIGKYLIEKYKIKPHRVVAHSDIAPTRKDDPGGLFPWKILYQNGIGAWYDSTTISKLKSTVQELPSIRTYQIQLNKYGYGIQITGVMDNLTIAAIIAFQRHFRPQYISGEMDLETYIILLALIEKYYN